MVREYDRPKRLTRSHTELMKLLADARRGDWIVDRAGAWGSVGGVAGTGFEAYARLLHPIEASREDLTRTDVWGQHPIVAEATWSWAAVAERTGRVMHPLVQWLTLTADESLMQYPDGWTISQSRAGWFDPLLLAALTEHLAKATTTPESVVVAFWNGWGFDSGVSFFVSDVGVADGQGNDGDAGQRSRDSEEQYRGEAASALSVDFLDAVRHGPFMEYPGRQFVLLEGSLAELADPAWGYRAGIGWMEGHPDPAPQMVWPSDQAWVVASEIDWDSTIVAGSRALIDDVLRDARFEAFEVRAEDELTDDSDIINE
jgi:hypothetical protein